MKKSDLKVTFEDGSQQVIIDIVEQPNGNSTVEITFEPELKADETAGSAVALGSQFFNWLVEGNN